MAYSTIKTVADLWKSPTPSPSSTGQASYQTSTPAPMYQAPTTPAPKAATTPMYSTQSPTPNPAPLVAATTQSSAQQQLAQEAANLARTGSAQGTAPMYTPQQMSQQAEQNALMARASANPGNIQYGSTNSQGQTYQVYQAPAPQPTYTTPTVQALTGRRTDDGGYAGLTRTQVQTLFGNDFTGITQDPNGTYSITADALKSRGGSTTGKFSNELINLGDGKYSVTRPNVWSADEERILRGHAQELQAIERQNAQPGVDPRIVASNQYRLEYLRNQVNELGQRKQAYELAGGQDTTGLSDQEYLESLLTNPDVQGDSLAAAQRAVGLNQDTYRRQAQQAANSALEAATNKINENYQTDRDKLINQLALRGLSPDSDSYAQTQLNDLDNRYRELRQAEEARSQASMLALDDKTREYLSNLADKRLEEAHKKVADFAALQNAKANALAKETKSQVDLGRLAALEEKNRLWGLNESEKRELDQMKVALQERGVDLKEEQNPSIIAKNEAQAAQSQATADYTSGARTDKTVADTGYVQAKTETENALRGAKLSKLKAEAAKLWKSGSSSTSSGGKTGGSGTPTDEELLGAQEMFQGQGGTGVLSGQKLKDAVQIYRAARSLNDPKATTSPSLTGAVEQKADYKKKTSTGSGFVDPFK